MKAKTKPEPHSAIAPPVAEYMRIRRYVITLIYRNADRSVKLPTILELAAKFGVSRQTVGKAMKQLTDDGYVIGKPGIGSFTNPAAMPSASKNNLPVFGLLISDGRSIHLDEYVGKTFAAMICQTVEYPANVYPITLSSSEQDDIYNDIRNACLDGLIWSGTRKYLEPVILRLHQEQFPIVSLGSWQPGVSGVQFDYEQFGYECGQIFLAEGRKNIVFLGDTPPWNLPADGIRRAFREAGVELNAKLFLPANQEILQIFRQIVDFGMPVDAVYNPLFVNHEVEEILNGVDTVRQCRVVCSEIAARNNPDFHGICYQCDFLRCAAEAVRLLRLRRDNPASAPVHTMIPLNMQHRRWYDKITDRSRNQLSACNLWRLTYTFGSGQVAD